MLDCSYTLSSLCSTKFPLCDHGCHRTFNLLCDLATIYGGYGRYRDVCVFCMTGGVWGKDKFRIQVRAKYGHDKSVQKSNLVSTPNIRRIEIQFSASTINLRDRRKDTCSPIEIHCLRFGLEAVNCVLVRCTLFEILINVVTWVFSPVKVVRIN